MIIVSDIINHTDPDSLKFELNMKIDLNFERGELVREASANGHLQVHS